VVQAATKQSLPLKEKALFEGLFLLFYCLMNLETKKRLQ
jgi:hypothetical protein